MFGSFLKRNKKKNKCCKKYKKCGKACKGCPLG